jgi:hypothetical protein
MPYAKGTCQTCGADRAPGKSRCAQCLTARRKEDRALREHRRAHHLCITCGKRASRERKYCAKHLAYYFERYARTKG